MRFMRALIAIAFLVLGAAVGALNRQPVTVDFGAAMLPTTLGVALIAALLVGVLVGGIAASAAMLGPGRSGARTGTER
ncbi:MAG TPA: LapA family protein [Lysobacter sp.]|nr:LapA family protein [Lysobacter sp.]